MCLRQIESDDDDQSGLATVQTQTTVEEYSKKTKYLHALQFEKLQWFFSVPKGK